MADTWSAVQAPAPTNSGANPLSSINALSCASLGKCTAVGSYVDSAGDQQGAEGSEFAGGLLTVEETTTPGNAATNPVVRLLSVSCATIDDCSAVGTYGDSSSHQQGLLVSESAGTWSSGVQAALPASAGADPSVALGSVKCASAGSCAAVGSFVDGLGNTQGLELTESAGAWPAGVQAAVPANADADPGVNLNSVSCPSAGNCTAVGSYSDSSGHRQGLLVSAAPVNPSLAVSAPPTATAGSPIAPSAITASISGGLAPSGAVTFTVFGPEPTPPASCASGGAAVGSTPVAANGGYSPPASFTPPLAGSYWWYVSYGGDPFNNPAASACGAGMAHSGRLGAHRRQRRWRHKQPWPRGPARQACRLARGDRERSGVQAALLGTDQPALRDRCHSHHYRDTPRQPTSRRLSRSRATERQEDCGGR